jgi:hypothetical protein
MTLTGTDVPRCGYIERAGTVSRDSVHVDGAMLSADDVLRRESYYCGDCWGLNVEHHASEVRSGIPRRRGLCKAMTMDGKKFAANPKRMTGCVSAKWASRGPAFQSTVPSSSAVQCCAGQSAVHRSNYGAKFRRRPRPTWYSTKYYLQYRTVTIVMGRRSSNRGRSRPSTIPSLGIGFCSCGWAWLGLGYR